MIVEFLLNELSIEDQFKTREAFDAALEVVMRMRACAQRHGRAIRVAAALPSRRAADGKLFRDLVRGLPTNQRRAVLGWVEKDGPFLEDNPLTRPSDPVTHKGGDVSGSSLAEAAYRRHMDDAVAVAGFAPSSYDHSPLLVGVGPQSQTEVALENFWSRETLEGFLLKLAPAVRSWDDFDVAIRRDFSSLRFSTDCVARNHPFNPGVADRIRKLLDMLSRMKDAILPDGTYGDTWNNQWTEWFKGGELFSDSSDAEKVEFKSELTFPHPDRDGEKFMCSWHGKVNSPKVRVHFSYPIKRNEPTYVVYIGLKLTKG